jgi:hypothetical protein
VSGYVPFESLKLIVGVEFETKLVPVTVAVWLPDDGPLFGDIDVTVGASSLYVKPPVNIAY